MKLIYVSGPFSAPSEGFDELHGYEHNITTASMYALALWRAGWAVICPHKNNANYQYAEDVEYNTWIDGDVEILRRCDAVLMIPGWEESNGAQIERKYALNHDVKVFYAINGIPKPEDI